MLDKLGPNELLLRTEIRAGDDREPGGALTGPLLSLSMTIYGVSWPEKFLNMWPAPAEPGQHSQDNTIGMWPKPRISL